MTCKECKGYIYSGGSDLISVTVVGVPIPGAERNVHLCEFRFHLACFHLIAPHAMDIWETWERNTVWQGGCEICKDHIKAETAMHTTIQRQGYPKLLWFHNDCFNAATGYLSNVQLDS